MDSPKLIADQLQRAYAGEAWHGPCLQDVLAGVTAGQATAKPIAGAHSIWELVLHLKAWVAACRRKLAGESLKLTTAEDWPAQQDGETWDQTLAALADEQRRLFDAISALQRDHLKTMVPGEPYSVYFMLQGAVQHYAYHGGQIALLKKTSNGDWKV